MVDSSAVLSNSTSNHRTITIFLSIDSRITVETLFATAIATEGTSRVLVRKRVNANANLQLQKKSVKLKKQRHGTVLLILIMLEDAFHAQHLFSTTRASIRYCKVLAKCRAGRELKITKPH